MSACGVEEVDTAGGQRRPLVGSFSAEGVSRQLGMASRCLLQGRLLLSPCLSLACLGGGEESRRGRGAAASPSISTFKFHFLSQPFFLVANYHLLQDVKNILPGINC